MYFCCNKRTSNLWLLSQRDITLCDSYHKGTSLYMTPFTKGHHSIYLIFHSLPFSRFVLIDREISSIGISGPFLSNIVDLQNKKKIIFKQDNPELIDFNFTYFWKQLQFCKVYHAHLDGGTLWDNKKPDQAKDQKMTSSQLLDTDKCTAVRTGAYESLGCSPLSSPLTKLLASLIYSCTSEGVIALTNWLRLMCQSGASCLYM